jgi:hypothetical protein
MGSCLPWVPWVLWKSFRRLALHSGHLAAHPRVRFAKQDFHFRIFPSPGWPRLSRLRRCGCATFSSSVLKHICSPDPSVLPGSRVAMGWEVYVIENNRAENWEELSPRPIRVPGHTQKDKKSRSPHCSVTADCSDEFETCLRVRDLVRSMGIGNRGFKRRIESSVGQMPFHLLRTVYNRS